MSERIEDEIKVMSPWYFGRIGWTELQELHREALINDLITDPDPKTQQINPRTVDDIDHLVDWGNPAGYYYSHRDPNEEVGNRFPKNQSFHSAKVAVAFKNAEPIGFMYTAHNVLGKKLIRASKMATYYKDYVWLRECVLKPEEDVRGKGLAKRLGQAILENERDTRALITHVWPDELPKTPKILESKGFQARGSTNERIFGKDSSPIKQVTYKAKSIGLVLDKLKESEKLNYI